MHPAAGLGSREAALLAAEWTCPRCGAPRDAASAYCIECGLRLPELRGAVASFRRRWVRRIGWYPGDWVWVPLLAFVLATAGAAAAVVVSRHRDGQQRDRSSRRRRCRNAQRAVVPTRRTDASRGRLAGAAGRSSSPRTRSRRGRAAARATAAACRPRQARAGGDARLEQLREPEPGLRRRLQRNLRLVGRGAGGAETRSASGFRRRAFRANSPLNGLAGVYQIENICNTASKRVESPPGRGRTRRSEPVSDKVCWHNARKIT